MHSTPRPAKVANLERKRAKELARVFHWQGHQPRFVFMGGVPPTEGDLFIHEGNQSMIGDSDSVGVAAEVAENVLWTAEWTFFVFALTAGCTGAAPDDLRPALRKTAAERADRVT